MSNTQERANQFHNRTSLYDQHKCEELLILILISSYNKSFVQQFATFLLVCNSFLMAHAPVNNEPNVHLFVYL